MKLIKLFLTLKKFYNYQLKEVVQQLITFNQLKAKQDLIKICFARTVETVKDAKTIYVQVQFLSQMFQIDQLTCAIFAKNE